MRMDKKWLLMTVTVGLFTNWYTADVYAYDGESLQTRDVVITATRTEQEVKGTPTAVEVITNEDLEQMGAENLAQALQKAIGLDISSNSMVGNSVSIRGAKSNQTLILVDGMRIRTENTTQTANNYELQRINMSDVERVEIIRGAASSIYGADAMGGVINIITKTPDKPSKSVFLDWTSKQADEGFRFSTGNMGKFSVSLSYKHSDVRRIEMYGGTNQYGHKDYYNFKGKYKLDDNKSLGFFYDYMKEDLYFDNDFTSYANDRSKIGISYDGKDSKGNYQIRLNYTKFDKDQNTRENGTLTGFDELKFRTLTLDAQRSTAIGDNHLLTYGGEIRKETYEGTRIAAGGDNIHNVTKEGITQPYSEKTTTYSAAYLQDEWMVNDQWLFIPSLRFDHNTAFGSKATYKLGNTIFIKENSRLKVNFGTAYRAPTEAELYMKWQHTPVNMPMMRMNVNVLGNPDLKPETSYNFDIGLEGEFDENTSGKLTFFKSHYKDLINLKTTTVRTPGMPMIIDNNAIYENIDSADIQGLEAEATKKLGKFYSLRGTYTYLDAKDDAGVRLEGRERQKLSLQLNYDNQAEGWSGSLWNDWHVDYLSDEGNGLENHSVSILNCVVSKELGNNSNAYFGINNLLGRDDMSDYNVFGLTGRVWRAGMNWNF